MLAIFALPTLAYHAAGTLSSHHAGTLRQPTRPAAVSSLRMGASDSPADEFDLDLLAQRIQSVQSVQEPASVRLFVLDAMTPGQRLAFMAPQPLWETLQSHEALVMFGMNPARRTLCTHGVRITVEESTERPDGSADVVLAAGRLCEIIELGGLEGSRWQGHEASVRWVNFDLPDESLTDEVLARSDALSARVETWCALVREGRERSAGQLDGVMRDLGPMPSASAASERALWIAGLIKCAASPERPPCHRRPLTPACPPTMQPAARSRRGARSSTGGPDGTQRGPAREGHRDGA